MHPLTVSFLFSATASGLLAANAPTTAPPPPAFVGQVVGVVPFNSEGSGSGVVADPNNGGGAGNNPDTKPPPSPPASSTISASPTPVSISGGAEATNSTIAMDPMSIGLIVFFVIVSVVALGSCVVAYFQLYRPSKWPGTRSHRKRKLLASMKEASSRTEQSQAFRRLRPEAEEAIRNQKLHQEQQMALAHAQLSLPRSIRSSQQPVDSWKDKRAALETRTREKRMTMLPESPASPVPTATVTKSPTDFSLSIYADDHQHIVARPHR